MQLILASFGWYVISAGHFPQKSLSRNPRIGFPLSPPPGHTLLPLTHDLPPHVLAGYRLVKSGPCVCSTSTCVQNLPAVFAVVWRLVCTSCRLSLTSYGVSYFFIPHSLWLTPLRSRALLDCELFFLQPILFFPFYSLATIYCRNTLSFLLWRYLTSTCWAILGLLLILLSMTQYGHLGFVLHCLWALLSHLFPLGHPWPICFP